MTRTSEVEYGNHINSLRYVDAVVPGKDEVTEQWKQGHVLSRMSSNFCRFVSVQTDNAAIQLQFQIAGSRKTADGFHKEAIYVKSYNLTAKTMVFHFHTSVLAF